MTESSRSCKGGPAGGLPRLGERGRPVSEEVRSRAVLAVVEEGMTVSAAARRFGVSRDSVDSWVKRFRERGHVRRVPMGGRASRIEPERERRLARHARRRRRRWTER